MPIKESSSGLIGFLFVCFILLRDIMSHLTVWPSLAQNPQSFSFNLPSTEVTGMYRHAQR